jgi:hypothetical protein
MSIHERISAAREIGDGANYAIIPPIFSPELRQKQDENWIALGERVGFAIKELTGGNIFEPNEQSENSGEWKAVRLSPDYKYDFVQLMLVKSMDRSIHSIVVSYGSFPGLTIEGRSMELSELKHGSRSLRDATPEEIEEAFARAIISPRVTRERKSRK